MLYGCYTGSERAGSPTAALQRDLVVGEDANQTEEEVRGATSMAGSCHAWVLAAPPLGPPMAPQLGSTPRSNTSGTAIITSFSIALIENSCNRSSAMQIRPSFH